MNTNEDRTPDPLRDARYGVAYTAAAGMFDTAGWTPPAAGEYPGFGDDGAAMRAQFDGGGRRDYGPQGCAGTFVLGGVLVLAFVALFVLKAFGVIQ